MKRVLLGAAALLIAAGVTAQTPLTPPTVARMANAVKICDEGCSITAVSNPAAMLQFGTGTTWCNPQVYTSFPLLVSYASENLALCAFDPLYGTAKEIDAQQLAAAYTVSYTDAGGAAQTVPIAALAGNTTPPVTTPPPGGTPTTLQAIQYTCAAPVAGTVIPAGLPTNGIVIVCVYGLTELPVPTAPVTTP